LQERRQWTSTPHVLEGLALVNVLPSFVLMLALLPVVDRIRNLAWARAIMQGLVPGVIGVMAIALVRMAPHAVPDPPALAVLLATSIALILWRIAPLEGHGGWLRVRSSPRPRVRPARRQDRSVRKPVGPVMTRSTTTVWLNLP
jgi:hypothetical protein